MDKEKMKKIIFLIFTLMIIIVIVLAVLIYFLINRKNEYSQNEYVDYQKSAATQIEKIEVNTGFFSADNCINKYIENNEDYKYYSEEMYTLELESGSVVFIKGNLIVNNKENSLYYVIKITNKDIYKIEPITESVYLNASKNIIDSKYYKDISIEENNDNKYENIGMNTKNLIEKYFEYFIDISYVNPEKAYNLIDEEYREKRFQNINNFKDYVKKMQKKWDLYAITQTSRTLLTENTDLIFKDNYENGYTIKVIAPMQFTIILDDYTIQTDEFKTKYNEASDDVKAVSCLDKFIKMINNKDYSASYKVLDETFKKNKFNTEKKYIEYIEKVFFDYNIATINSVEQNNGIYVYTVTLKSGNGVASDITKKTINIKLLEETNFVMSFNVD